jgi:AraC family transcriptional regulator
MSPEPDLRPAPLAVPQRDWLGPPIHLHPYLGEIAGKDIVFDEPLVALALSGRGARTYRTYGRTRELYTVPRMLEIQGAGSTIDEGHWHGQAGVIISCELPEPLLQRLLPDTRAFERIGTHHEVFDSRLESLLKHLWEEASVGSPLGAVYAEGMVIALAALLVGSYGSDAVSQHKAGHLSPVQRKRVLEFVESNLATDISVSQMAAAAQIPPDRFARAFKQTFGVPPHAYVLERRVNAAGALIRATPSLSLAEVAVASGFSSQAHLASAFKSELGVSPSAWRRAG